MTFYRFQKKWVELEIILLSEVQSKKCHKFSELGNGLSSSVWVRTWLFPIVLISSHLLTGVPGLTAAHVWISLPFCFMFFLALTGNGALMSLIWTDHRLHQPMFLFLARLSFVDLVLSLSTLPKMLAIFWFGATAIHFHFCLFQMFLIHSFSAMESGVLVAMAFDRFVAICNPLRYAITLTPGVVSKIGGLVVLRGVGLTLFFPILAQRLSFCGSHTIAYTYCEHMAVVKLACGDTAVDSFYAFAVALFLGVGDMAFIAYSYGQIEKTVLHFPSPEARAKASSTCTAHVCVILFFYGPGFLSVVMQRFGPPTASSAKVLLVNLYLLFPPALDPIVYGVKTKQIREHLFTIIHPKWNQSH
ncbi:olfactory receptor 52K1-like [Dipodomys merriami]|uniref:olfactory receptor 52K1-like n=1 Tax=Dipodomys merriami TaxID=94247 RepID=UPI0038557677